MPSSLYDWLTFACVFVAALYLAFDTGCRQINTDKPLADWIGFRWLGYAPLLLIVVASGLIVWKVAHPNERPAQQPMNAIAQTPKSTEPPISQATPQVVSLASRSPSDADKEIPLIDRLYEAIGKRAAPEAEQTQQIINRWQDAFDKVKGADYFKSLSGTMEELSGTSAAILVILQEQPGYCENDLCTIAEPRKVTGDLLTQMSKLNRVLQEQDSLVDPAKVTQSRATMGIYNGRSGPLIDIMEPYSEAVGEALQSYEKWVADTKTKLLDRRKHLSDVAGAPHS